MLHREKHTSGTCHILATVLCVGNTEEGNGRFFSQKAPTMVIKLVNTLISIISIPILMNMENSEIVFRNSLMF